MLFLHLVGHILWEVLLKTSGSSYWVGRICIRAVNDPKVEYDWLYLVFKISYLIVRIQKIVWKCHFLPFKFFKLHWRFGKFAGDTRNPVIVILTSRNFPHVIYQKKKNKGTSPNSRKANKNMATAHRVRWTDSRLIKRIWKILVCELSGIPRCSGKMPSLRRGKKKFENVSTL